MCILASRPCRVLAFVLPRNEAAVIGLGLAGQLVMGGIQEKQLECGSTRVHASMPGKLTNKKYLILFA